MQRELHNAQMRDQGIIIDSRAGDYFVPLERQPKRCQVETLVLRAPPVVRRRHVSAYAGGVAAYTRAELEKLGVRGKEEEKESGGRGEGNEREVVAIKEKTVLPVCDWRGLYGHEAAFTQGGLECAETVKSLLAHIAVLDTEMKELLARSRRSRARNSQYCATNKEIMERCGELEGKEQRLWDKNGKLERESEGLVERTEC